MSASPSLTVRCLLAALLLLCWALPAQRLALASPEERALVLAVDALCVAEGGTNTSAGRQRRASLLQSGLADERLALTAQLFLPGTTRQWTQELLHVLAAAAAALLLVGSAAPFALSAAFAAAVLLWWAGEVSLEALRVLALAPSTPQLLWSAAGHWSAGMRFERLAVPLLAAAALAAPGALLLRALWRRRQRVPQELPDSSVRPLGAI